MRRIFIFAVFLLAACTPLRPRVVTAAGESPRFYAKSLNCGGIVIRSSRRVADTSLSLACRKIDRMLAGIPIVRQNLVDKGAELHIIAAGEVTSDLPEWRFRRDKIYVDNLGHLANIDTRTRGMGGLVSSCGEENILRLRGDRYPGQDICVHEFAHTIMDYGLSPDVTSVISSAYDSAVKSGLWKHAYASVNSKEYFAELSEWYFGSHGQFVDRTLGLPRPGRAALHGYDPRGFNVLRMIYGGYLAEGRITMTHATPLTTCVRSTGGRVPAVLVVANDTDSTVKLDWITYKGAERNYAKIPAYDRIQRPTRVQHVWALRDNYGRLLGCWRVDTPYSRINVGL